jgi:RNA recognition motif. (a.k.a. RRM, RBD, or RNP domain)
MPPVDTEMDDYNDENNHGGVDGTTTVTPPTLIQDVLAAEAEESDGYFSDEPLDIQPNYPVLDENFTTSTVITNLPIVPQSKLDKLTKVLMKLVTKIGPLQQYYIDNTNVENGDDGNGNDEPTIVSNGFYMTCTTNDTTSTSSNDDTNMTLGFCFVDYESYEHAQNAVDVLNGYSFDKKHLLSVTLYNRAQQLQTVDTTTFVQPTIVQSNGYKIRINVINSSHGTGKKQRYIGGIQMADRILN